MQEFLIDNNSSGQRLDRYITKLLPEIPKGLVNKSIRKKNITVNKSKQKNNYILKENDIVQVFFSDETLDKFKGEKLTKNKSIPKNLKDVISNPVYEDNNFIVINKPDNLLSQPDKTDEIAVTDLIKELDLKKGTFSPAPLNRLDRNTTGIVIIPKNYQSQRLGAELIRKRQTKKEYLALVFGNISSEMVLTNSFKKDEEINKVTMDEGNDVALKISPIIQKNNLTLLKVDLITGKSHQIRAQLKAFGHPIVGDRKYGDFEKNKKFKKKYNLNNQLLHAYSYVLGEEPILDVKAELPAQFNEILKDELDLEDGFLEKTTYFKG